MSVPHAQDLKRVLKKAGLEGRNTVFLFSDTQIVQEGFLEDLNNILNAGQSKSQLHPFQHHWCIDLLNPDMVWYAPTCWLMSRGNLHSLT